MATESNKISRVGDLKNLSPTSLWDYPNTYCPTKNEILNRIQFYISPDTSYDADQLVKLSDISVNNTYPYYFYRESTPGTGTNSVAYNYYYIDGFEGWREKIYLSERLSPAFDGDTNYWIPSSNIDNPFGNNGYYYYVESTYVNNTALLEMYRIMGNNTEEDLGTIYLEQDGNGNWWGDLGTISFYP